MPRVPVYGLPRAQTAPIPDVRLQAQDNPAAEGAATGEAIAQGGAEVSNFATKLIANEFAQARQMAEEAPVLDATSKLTNWTTNTLHDPQSGVLNTVKGKAAVDLPNTVGAQFDQYADGLASTLKTPQQQMAFAKVRATRREQMLQTLEIYGSDQAQQYWSDQVDASIIASQSAAIANATDPQRVSQEMGHITALVDAKAQRSGLSPEARAELLTKALSSTNSGIIDRLLSQDQYDAAQAYFNAAKAATQAADSPATPTPLTAQALVGYEEKLQNAGVDDRALKASTAIWDAHAPADDKAPINIDQMEADARAQFANDPRVLKATIEWLRQQAAGVEAGRKQRADANTDTVYTAIMNNAPLAQVRLMPEFGNLPGPEQDKIRDYYNRQAEHQASLAYTNEARAETRQRRLQAQQEREQEIKGWSVVFDYEQDPAKLAQTSRADIVSLLPQIGPSHVQRLLNEQADLNKNREAVRSATIDNATFTSVAKEAGLDYAAAPKGEEQKGTLAQLKADVLGAIAERQRATNKPMATDEKADLMRKIIEPQVYLNYAFRPDPQMSAVLVPQGERANAYIPISQIPPSALSQAVNYLRGLDPRLTDDQIKAKYLDRIQKAYARTLMRGTRQEVEGILKGEGQ